MLKLYAAAHNFAMEGFDALKKREEGQTMAEYGVVLAVITIGIITALTLLSTRVRGAIENVAGLLPG
jgi:Flp pilus assembly pilin Flp